jgi:hypothetical protein
VVVATALEDKIVKDGGPAVCDPTDVVRLAPLGRPVTAGEAAVLVADHERVEQVGGDGAGGRAIVQDAGPSSDEDTAHSGVAEQPTGGRAVENGAVDQPGLAAALEVGEGRDDVEVRPVPSPAPVALVVKEPAAHVNEGVGAAVGGVPRGLAVDVGPVRVAAPSR